MLGDLNDDRREINVFVLNKLDELLEKLDSLEIPIYYILGNHDVFYKNDNSINSIKPILRGFKNLNLIDSPTEINIENKNFIMIPWINDNNYNQNLEYLKSREPEIFNSYVLGHFAFAGLMPFEKNNDSKLNLEYFKKYKGLFSGHYHLRVKDKNVHYVGSILDFKWGEELSSHGFCVLNEDKINYINTENIHKKYTINSEDDLKIILDECKNKVIKLIITKNLNINSSKYDYYILNIDKKCQELQVLPANDLFLNNLESEKIINIKSFDEFIKGFLEDKNYGNNISNVFLEKYFVSLYNSVTKGK